MKTTSPANDAAGPTANAGQDFSSSLHSLVHNSKLPKRRITATIDSHVVDRLDILRGPLARSRLIEMAVSTLLSSIDSVEQRKLLAELLQQEERTK